MSAADDWVIWKLSEHDAASLLKLIKREARQVDKTWRGYWQQQADTLAAALDQAAQVYHRRKSAQIPLALPADQPVEAVLAQEPAGPDRAALEECYRQMEALNAAHTAELSRAYEQLEVAILERRQVETALTMNARQLQTITENAPDLILKLDGDGTIIYINRTLPGFQLDEIIGRNFLDWVPASYHSLVAAKLAALLATGQRQEYEIQGPETHGLPRWYQSRLAPALEDGRVTGAILIITDITERRQVELEREGLIADLQAALAQVNRLSGLLPICASCKRIRNDQGYWQQVEVYIGEHSEAEFSHGICPECRENLYPRELYPYLYK